jgi:hypothetical protein
VAGCATYVAASERQEAIGYACANVWLALTVALNAALRAVGISSPQQANAHGENEYRE